MAPPKFSIKIPAEVGLGKEQFIRVDPSKLSLNILTELWEHDSLQHAYRPARGIESAVSTDVDVSEMIVWWEENLPIALSVLSGAEGEAYDIAKTINSIFDDLPQVIQLVADGRIAHAQKAMKAIFYELLNVASTSIESTMKNEEAAEASSELAVIMAEQYAQHDPEGIVNSHIEDLVVGISEGLEVFKKLQAYESRLKVLVAKLSHGDFAGKDEVLKEFAAFFGDDKEGFIDRASTLLLAPEDVSIDDLTAMIAEGEQQLEHLDQWKELSIDAQAEDVSEVQSAVKDGHEINILIGSLQERRQKFKEAKEKGLDVVSQAGQLLTKEELDAWNSSLEHPKWQSMMEVRRRLNGLAEEAHRLAAIEPDISKEDQQRIDTGRFYIDRLKRELEGRIGPPDDSPVDSASLSEFLEQDEIDPQRLEEIYEVVLAIAAVKYCNRYNFSGGTVNSMLDLARRLGKIAEDEIALYKPVFAKKLWEDSVFVEDSLKVVHQWRAVEPAQAHWISFFAVQGRSRRRRKLWRLVKPFQDEGLKLCDKHGMDPEEIRRVFKERKDEQRRLSDEDEDDEE